MAKLKCEQIVIKKQNIIILKSKVKKKNNAREKLVGEHSLLQVC